MPDTRKTIDELNTLAVEQRPRLIPPSELAADDALYDINEPPSVFVRVVLGLFAFVMAVLLFLFYTEGLRPISNVPEFRYSIEEIEPTVVADSPEEGKSNIWIGTRKNGVRCFNPDVLLSEYQLDRKSTGNGLLSDHVSDIDISRSLISFTCESGGRRGAVTSRGNMVPASGTFSKRPLLDYSSLGQAMGNSLSSACVGKSPETLWVGSSTSGLGRYRRHTRHWGPTYTKHSGAISSDHITDLRPWSGGLLVASDYGLDVCRDDLDSNGGDLSKVDSSDEFGSRGIKSLHPRRSSDGLDLWCASFGKGVSRANIRPDGRIDTPEIIISERSVAGLDTSKCRMAAYNARKRVLCVAFEQTEGMGVARYRFADHDWLGTNRALPVSDLLDVQSDESDGVLAGTADGVWHVHEQTNAQADHLTPRFRGLENERVAELAASPSWIWAHSQWQAPPGLSAVRLRCSPNTNDSSDGQWQWSDLIGPGRFMDLREDDILCADYVADDKTYYFGTRGKGIGKYHGDSHDLEPVGGDSDSDSPLGGADLIDIAAAGGGAMAVVTGEGELFVRSMDKQWRQAWSNSQGLPMERNEVTCAAANDRLLFVGSDSVIGSYDVKTHQWRQLPNLDGLGKLYCTGGVLWALTDSRQLFSLKVGENEARWQPKLQDVVRISRSRTGLLILARQDNGVNAVYVAGGSVLDELVALCQPRPLDGAADSSRWSSCCATGKLLYLAGDKGSIDLYNLNTRAWTTIELPDYVGGVRRMSANSRGLWVLSDEDALVLWNSEHEVWSEAPVCENVESFARHGMDDLLVLLKPRQTGDVGSEQTRDRLLLVSGGQDRRVLIGPALDADTWNEKITVAAEFNDTLFLASGGNVARYRTKGHGWKSFNLDGSHDVRAAQSGNYLYALGRQGGPGGLGTLFRYDPAADDFLAMRAMEGLDEGFRVRQFAGDSRNTLVMHVPRKGLYRIDDARADDADLLHGSSAVGLENAQVQSAAAVDRELFLADDRGRIHRYGSQGDGGAAVWSVCVDGSAEGDSSRGFAKILFPHKDLLAAVGTNSIDIFGRTDGTSNWQRKNRIARGDGACDAWKTDGGGGILTAWDKPSSTGHYKTIGMLNLDGSVERTLVGAGIEAPAGKTRLVQQWTVAKERFLFRVNDSGRMFRYSLRTHTWTKEAIKNVEALFQSLKNLWCFSRDGSRLYYCSSKDGAPQWKAFEAAGPIADFAFDDQFLILRYENGCVEFMMLRDNGKIAAGELIGESPRMQNSEGKTVVSAYAELDHGLFVSLKGGDTWRYDILGHSWSKSLPEEIRCFVRADNNPARLFALGQHNELFHWDAGRGEFSKFTSLPPIKSVHCHQGTLWAVSSRGELMRYNTEVDNHDGWTVLASNRSALSGPSWPEIASAAEYQGKLVLGLRPDGDGGDIACVYDPESMKWSQCKIHFGRIANFVPWDNRLVAVAFDRKTKTFTLLDLDMSRHSARPLLSGISDVDLDQQSAWCLVGGNRVVAIDRSKDKPSEVFADPLMLPDDVRERIASVRAAGDRLMVVGDGGSIWHHVHGKSGWRKMLGTAGGDSTFKRNILQVGCELLASAPEGGILHFDRRAGVYAAWAEQEPVVPHPAQAEWEKWEFQDKLDDHGGPRSFHMEAGRPFVLAKDGAVWNRVGEEAEWKQILEPIENSPMSERRLVKVAGRLVVSSADGSLACYNAQSNSFVVPKEGRLPSRAGELDKSVWKVRENEDGGFEVSSNDGLPWTKPAEFFNVKEIALAESMVYLRSNNAVYAFDRNETADYRIHDINDPKWAELFSKPSKYVFDGLRFKCRIDKDGDWKTVEKDVALRVEMKSTLDNAAGTMVLRPHAVEMRFGFAHQWVGEVCFDDENLMVSIPNGTALLRQAKRNAAGGDYRLVSTFRFDDSGDEKAFPALCRVGDDVFCRIGGETGTVLKWNAANLGWKSFGSAMPERAFESATTSVRRASALGPMCLLPDGESDMADGKLIFEFNQSTSLVGQLGATGFDFDRIVTMDVANGKSVLYTQAALLELDPRQLAGRPGQAGWIPTDVDVSAACGTVVVPGSYTVYRDVLPGHPHVLLSRGKEQGWSFDGSRWAELSHEQIDRLARENGKLLYDGTFCRWHRDDTVELQCQHDRGTVKKMLKARFDADAGRFDFDRVSAIGYFDHNAWALTDRGLVQPLEDGTIRVFDVPHGVDQAGEAGFFVVPGRNGQEYLALKLTSGDKDTRWLLWQQSRWKMAPDSGEIHEAIQNAEDTLLANGHWKVSRSQINALPVRKLQMHWLWAPPGRFDTVAIDMDHESFPARFDFERINDFVIEGDHLWIATGHGIMLYGISARQMMGWDRLSQDAPEVDELFLHQGTIFASSDSMLFRNDSNRMNDWSRGTDDLPAKKDNSTLLDCADWKVVSDDSRSGRGIVISRRLAEDERDLVEVELSDDKGGLRFDFDVVTSVAGSGKTVALASGRGLLERPDADLDSLRKSFSREGDLPVDADCEVFQFGPEGMVNIYCESAGRLWRLDEESDCWAAVKARDAQRIEQERSSTVAKNSFWYITKEESEELLCMISMPRDKYYTKTDFNAEQGLFDFDVMHDVVSLKEANRVEELFVATEGGVVRRRMDAHGPWERRYCNPERDGVVMGTIYNLAGNGSDVIMLRKASENNSSCRVYKRDEDSWGKSGTVNAAAERFAKLKSLHKSDPGGWAIADIDSYRRLSPTRSPASGPHVGLEHGGQPIWLVDTEAGLLCAHDIVYSLDCYQDRLWLGTAGGCVAYPIASDMWQSNISLNRSLHLATGFLPDYDIWQPADPPRVGFVEQSAEGDALVCFPLDAYDSIRDARYDTRTCLAISPANPHATYSENAGRLSAEEAAKTLHVLNNRLWKWTKSGPYGFQMEFHEGAADLPRNYCMINDGAFRFFDISHTKDRRKAHRAMELSPQLLYVATAGGVMAFDSQSGEPQRLFARAETAGTTENQELESVQRLFYNHRRQSLAAQDTAGSVFLMDCSGDERFADVSAATNDPFAEANIVVDNSLLRWRQESDAAHIRLTNSDLPEDAPYRFFVDGKFSFDHVNQLAADDRGHIYFATGGGVVRAAADTREIEKVYARDFLDRGRSGVAPVSEIIFDRNCPDPSQPKLHARSGTTTWSMFGNDAWQRNEGRQCFEAFRREYTRASDSFWTWVRHPSGVSVQLHKSDPPGVIFGNSMIAPHDSLMSRGRFRWDDLREIELRGNDLFFTTPTGVCHYRYQSVDVSPQFIKLYTRADNGHEHVPMKNVERILGQNETLVAWNDNHVFTARKRDTSDNWTWKVDQSREPKDMKRQRLFSDEDTTAGKPARWGVRFDKKSKQLALHRVKSTTPRKAFDNSTEICAKELDNEDVDCSRSLATPAGIFQACGQKVIWFDTQMAKRQMACRPFAWVGVVLALVLFLWFLRFSSGTSSETDTLEGNG